MDNSPYKVNIKARIDRHSRGLKENITLKNKLFSAFKKNNFVYKFFVVLVFFSVPIYPMFAGVIHNSNEIDFYRGNIDEDSILGTYGSYYEKQEEISGYDILETQDNFLADTGLLSDDRNYEGTNEVRTYVIKSGDSISVIASKFGVSWDTIKVYNNLNSNVINPGNTLQIPSKSGIPYKIKSGDSILAIANKYKIDKNDILDFNGFDSSRTLKIGEEIFLPGAKKIIPKKKPNYISNSRKYAKTKTNTNYIGNQYTNSKGVYKLKWRKPYSGAWGNCTYYVASYKNVNWRGNANQWMRNAKAKGHKVLYGRGFKPKLGSIISLAGRGYNLRYGHVGIVMEVKDNYMIVSDMNYKKLNEVTYRKISLNDNRIVGYIYID